MKTNLLHLGALTLSMIIASSLVDQSNGLSGVVDSTALSQQKDVHVYH